MPETDLTTKRKRPGFGSTDSEPSPTAFQVPKKTKDTYPTNQMSNQSPLSDPHHTLKAPITPRKSHNILNNFHKWHSMGLPTLPVKFHSTSGYDL